MTTTASPDSRTVAAVLFSSLWDDAAQIGTTATGRAVWSQKGVLFIIADDMHRRAVSLDDCAEKFDDARPIEEVMKAQVQAHDAIPRPVRAFPKVSAAAKRRADRALDLLALLDRVGSNDDRWSDRALDNCFEMGDGAEVVAAIVHRFDTEQAVRELFKTWRVSRFVDWSLQPECPEYAVMMELKKGWRATYEAHMRAQEGHGTAEMDFGTAA